MKLRKKTLKYETGGKVKKKPKTVVAQKAGVTAEGDKMPELRQSKQLSNVTTNRTAEVQDIKTNVKEANVKKAAIQIQLRALPPAERGGKKALALKNQLRILNDSIRGHAKKQSGTKQNARGEYYE